MYERWLFLLATNKIEKCKNLMVSDPYRYFIEYLYGNDGNFDIDFKNYKQNINILKKNSNAFRKIIVLEKFT